MVRTRCCAEEEDDDEEDDDDDDDDEEVDSEEDSDEATTVKKGTKAGDKRKRGKVVRMKGRKKVEHELEEEGREKVMVTDW